MGTILLMVSNSSHGSNYRHSQPLSGLLLFNHRNFWRDYFSTVLHPCKHHHLLPYISRHHQTPHFHSSSTFLHLQYRYTTPTSSNLRSTGDFWWWLALYDLFVFGLVYSMHPCIYMWHPIILTLFLKSFFFYTWNFVF